jgi:hypothetical protein
MCVCGHGVDGSCCYNVADQVLYKWVYALGNIYNIVILYTNILKYACCWIYLSMRASLEQTLTLEYIHLQHVYDKLEQKLIYTIMRNANVNIE